MSTFASLLPAGQPISSTTALPVALLDRLAVDPDSLRQGVTVIEAPSGVASHVAETIDDLLWDGEACHTARWNDDRTQAYVLARFVDPGDFRRALATGKPVVLVAPADELPATAGAQADRKITLAPHLYDDIVQRTIALVSGEDVSESAVAGIAGMCDHATFLASVRPGSPAVVAIQRLRAITKEADDLIDGVVKKAKLLADIDEDPVPPARDAVPLADTVAKVVTRLRDLHGYGAAKNWGLQLAADLKAYKAGLAGDPNGLSWEDVDKGILLTGAPGTGKTYFARALAAECGVPLIQASYGDMEAAADSWKVSKAIKKVFADARKKAPCIVFMDELDSYGVRGGNAHNDSYWGALINGLLAELDGAEPRPGVVVVGATNNPDRVDRALRRPGRLERVVEIPLPDLMGLAGVIRHHAPGLVDVDDAARACRGRTPADVAMLCREARRAARRRGDTVTEADIVRAVADQRGKVDPVIDGISALHEAAHAVASVVLRLDMRSVSIDGQPVTEVMFNTALATRDYVERHVVMTLAARRADAMLGHGACAGAAVDLMQATSFVRRALTQWGMGSSLTALDGPPTRAERLAVEEVLETLDLRAAKLVDANRASILAVANALVDRRYLDGDQVRDIVDASALEASR